MYSHWAAKSSVQAFLASFGFYHCSLWDKSLTFRKFNIGLMQLRAWPSVKTFVTKLTAKFIVNKYDYINLNVIMVTTVITLNYGYGINSSEQCKH